MGVQSSTAMQVLSAAQQIMLLLVGQACLRTTSTAAGGRGDHQGGVAGVDDPTEFPPSTPLAPEFCAESVATQYENGVENSPGLAGRC